MEAPLLFGPYGRLQADAAKHLRESGANAYFFHGFRQELFD